ncbi:MAG: hypothetical protein FD134_1687 [Gallionellaceae bacterium]|nr:MAG: hypothetical protein FD134_1687 [Gallionellaceae bacterium]
MGANMKLSYDPKYNIAYLRFHEKHGTVTTIKISDEMNIDVAPDGGNLIIETSGSHREIALAA